MDTKRCASKDVGSRTVWIGESHINWKRERVPARTLAPKGWIVRSHIDWGEERNIIYKGVEITYVLRGSSEGKAPKKTILTRGVLEVTIN